MITVEARADFDNKRVILVDEAGAEQFAPGAVLTSVQIIEDSEGAILQGVLRETVGINYAPRDSSWRRATFTRSGKVVDRANQRTLHSCTAAIVKAGTIYYLGD